jgi:hypothetical protein
MKRGLKMKDELLKALTEISEDIEKGGKGSGIKGHRTPRKTTSGWTQRQHKEAAEEHLKQAGFDNPNRDYHLRMKDAHDKAAQSKSNIPESIENTFKIEEGKALSTLKKLAALKTTQESDIKDGLLMAGSGDIAKLGLDSKLAEAMEDMASTNNVTVKKEGNKLIVNGPEKHINHYASQHGLNQNGKWAKTLGGWTLDLTETKNKVDFKELQNLENQNMKKSEQEMEELQMDELIKTIKTLGKDGLKKALPNLSDAQKELLKEALIKAKDMTEASWGKKSKKPQERQELKMETVSNDPKGLANEDEELMDEANKVQNHQGGSQSKIEGWEGQVIKAEAISDEKLEETVAKAMDACGDSIKVKELLKKKGVAEVRVQGALDKYEGAKKSPIIPEGDEEVKKSEDIVEVKEEVKLEKSIQWSEPNALLKANTQGRNAHYSVEELILTEAAKKEELKKANESFLDGINEQVNKSEGKIDYNDLIEKAQDKSEEQLRDESQTVEKSGAYTVESFKQEDMEAEVNQSELQMGLKKSQDSEDSDWVEITEEEYHEELEKSVQGEGTRGGKVVGHTKSGKPIYEGSSSHKKLQVRSMADKLNPNLSPEAKAKARALRNSRTAGDAKNKKYGEMGHERYFKFRAKEGAMAGKKGEKIYSKPKHDDTNSGGVGAGASGKEKYGNKEGAQTGMGVNAEYATKYTREGRDDSWIERTREKAIEGHKKKLQAIKDAPKPNLTKSNINDQIEALYSKED